MESSCLLSAWSTVFGKESSTVFGKEDPGISETVTAKEGGDLKGAERKRSREKGFLHLDLIEVTVEERRADLEGAEDGRVSQILHRFLGTEEPPRVGVCV